MTDSWWPDGYDLPAFRVKRETYKTSRGGDRVRGSAWIQGTLTGGTLPVFDDGGLNQVGQAWVLGSPVPSGVPAWQPPSTAPDGTLPPTVPAAPGHIVQWRNDEGNLSWVNIGPAVDLPHTAVRYPSTTPEAFDAVGKALVFCRPLPDPSDSGIDRFYHTVEILWSWPIHIQDSWLEVALVRSSFGNPATPRDGVTVFRHMRGDFDFVEDGKTKTAPPPIVYDKLLPSGRWYYYTLFFRMNPKDWVATMSDACCLPHDWGHRNHLWDAVPPYYQWIDDNYRVGAGFLRQFLNTFGVSLDNTREFVEGVLNLYNIDFTPTPLLKGVGGNFDIPYEQGLGDIRYRALVAYGPNQQYRRGTQVGLKGMIEAASKYECGIESSSSLMLYPDDSEFYRSTGNWGGVHPDAAPIIEGVDPAFTSVPWNDVVVTRVDNKPPPTGLGRGVMRVYTKKSVATQKLMILVGDDRIRADNPEEPVLESADTFPVVSVPEYRDALPVSAGISIEPGRPYGFTIHIQGEVGCQATPFLLWAGPSGLADDVIALAIGLPGAVTTAWKEFRAQGYAPLDPDPARYLVPGLMFSSRAAGTTTNRSPWLDHAGAMVYVLSSDDTPVSVLPPDRYLTLGETAERIGDPDDPGAPDGFTGFYIGSPKVR